MISVLIPVYNVEKYLPQCLDSILEQEYNNFEVILVNDGSTDASPSICEEYVRKDSRFKLFHQPNQGFGEARNTGLKHAAGEYIYFMDSDDLLLPGIFTEVMAVFKTHSFDTVFFGFRKNYEGNGNPVYFDMVPPVLDQRDPSTLHDAIALMLLKGLGFGVWQQVFSKAFLDRANVKFPRLKREADIAFLLQVYRHLQTFKTIPRVFYIYQAYYSANKNNPDILPNHIILYQALHALFAHHRNSEKVVKILDRYFVLWFGHVIPIHIYLNNNLSLKGKVKEFKTMLQNTLYRQWRSEATDREGGGWLKRVVLLVHRLNSARLLYIATAINYTLKYRLRFNYKKIYYKNVE